MGQEPQQGEQRGRVEVGVAAAALVVGMVAIGLQVLPKGGIEEDAAAPVGDGRTTSTMRVETSSTTVDEDVGEVVFIADLRVGDCFDDSEFRSGTEVGDLTLIDCDQPHDAEVFLAVEIAGDEFPGIESVEAAAEDNCSGAFAPYVGIDPAGSRWEWGWIIPNQQAWDEGGERIVVCFVHDSDLEPIVGSKKDADD